MEDFKDQIISADNAIKFLEDAASNSKLIKFRWVFSYTDTTDEPQEWRYAMVRHIDGTNKFSFLQTYGENGRHITGTDKSQFKRHNNGQVWFQLIEPSQEEINTHLDPIAEAYKNYDFEA